MGSDACCWPWPPRRSAPAATTTAAERCRRRRRRRQELQDDADRRRQGRRVLHHDELRRPGEGQGARRHPRLPGPGPVRRRAADADRRRGRGQEPGRDPDRADRHEGAVRADHARRPQNSKIVLVDTTLEDPSMAVSQIASDNLEGGKTAAATLLDLIGGKGKVMVVNVKPGISTTDQRGQGLRGGRQGQAGRRVPRPGVLAGRPGQGGRDRHRDARQAPRPEGHLRREPVLRRGRRERPAAGRQARRREDRRLRRRPQAGQGPRGRARAGADRPEAGRHRRPGRRAGLQRARGQADERQDRHRASRSSPRTTSTEMQDVLYKPSC